MGAVQPRRDAGQVTSVTIRPAALADAGGLARLSGDLGYPAAPDDLRQRLLACQARPDDHGILVAIDDAGDVAGWVHVGRRVSLETRPRAEILGLVVDERVRRVGTGGALVARAEQWAREQGLIEMIVRSNVTRVTSHPFYERVGYTRTKTQHVYVKDMASARVS